MEKGGEIKERVTFQRDQFDHTKANTQHKVQGE